MLVVIVDTIGGHLAAQVEAFDRNRHVLGSSHDAVWCGLLGSKGGSWKRAWDHGVEVPRDGGSGSAQGPGAQGAHEQRTDGTQTADRWHRDSTQMAHIKGIVPRCGTPLVLCRLHPMKRRTLEWGFVST